ncbi:ERMES complex subunit mmm1 [Hypoxylon texense]
MSSSESSSSSRSQRPPLHERSESEKNKLQIRIVPYSPPRPGDAEASRPSAGGPGIGSDNVQSTTSDPATITPRTTRVTSYGKEDYGAESSSSPSFSTPASPLARAKGRGVSGSKLASDSSGVERTAPPSPVINRPSYGSNIRRINPQSQSSHHDDGPVSPTWKRSFSRRENFINVHADKTFSVVLKTTRPRNSDRSDSTLKSPLPSNTSTISSHEESSFDVSAEDRFGSPLSSVPERSISPSTPGSTSAAPEFSEEFAESSSPWNYRMVGGLRKVPKTPDLKGKGKEKEVPEEPPLPPLPLTIITPPEPEPQPSSPLATKQSFNSEQSASTIEETTNYKVIGRSSPPLPDTDSIDLPDLPQSSISPNYEILGQSSPAQTIASSAGPAFTSGFTDTPGSKNYIVYGDTSPAESSVAPFRGHRYHSSDESSLQQVRPSYSQESLVVPPLRPHKRSSSESLGYYKQQSRENLRGRANSFSSLSSIASLDTASLYSSSTPNVVILRHTPSTSSIPRSTWAAGPSNAGQQRARMDTHQWSSQLSTVMSEYEGSDPGSRVVSGASIPERLSSAFGSRDSRQMRSISSSLGLENLEARGSRGSHGSHSRSDSRSDSLDRPSPVHARNGRDQLPSPRPQIIRDHDEHGDGLADLQQLNSMPSRSRLGFSRQSSERSLRSTTSSRAGSLTASSLPSWARLYYGSGERRWLAPPSLRSFSEAGDSRPASPYMGGGSPSHDQYSQGIFNPRRRPKEIDPRAGRPSSMEIGPAGESGSIRLAPRKKTSSLWSPHLRLDTRASRFSIWNAPSVTWSADSGVFGKRNIQVVLFVLGFVIPFAWMIAAFLPLPPKPMLAMDERDRSTTEFHSSRDPESQQRRHVLVDDSRYQSARWWRNVNRFMAVAGLLIIGAVVALIVIGVRQRWTQ